ncbi:uncharacterized protein IL334_004835 [Kwoniella shivajii]|uniref:Histone-lysine N-methyltransferase, H3 lysine-4 specific n=1 Tax=Kwoniella shivajii TaxID=564305 RepID=A0ABZ1D1V4_9TREE|nr:hypothetical protein IL334_004835 [Kwoniella shivajii]
MAPFSPASGSGGGSGSGKIPPTGPKIPPSGPKALRKTTSNGIIPTGPSALKSSSSSLGLSNGVSGVRQDKVSITFPQTQISNQTQAQPQSQAGPSRIRQSPISIPFSSTSTSTIRSNTVGSGIAHPSSSSSSSSYSALSNTNIFGNGKSTNNGSSKSHTTEPSVNKKPIPSGPSLLSSPSTSSFPPSSSSSLLTNTHTPRRVPTSPKKRLIKTLVSVDPQNPQSQSHNHSQDNSDKSYISNFLPTDEASRVKVSISFGASSSSVNNNANMKNGTNGFIRPKPPHLDMTKDKLKHSLPFDQLTPPLPTPPPPPPPDGRPPTPPLGRPPTPPFNSRPPTPPPPEEQLPPPPPSPPFQAPSPLPTPPPQSSRPPSAPGSFYSSRVPSPPSSIGRPPSPPPIEPPSPPPPAPPSPGPSIPAPPSFHFRDLSIRRRTPSDEDEDEDEDLVMEPQDSTPPPPPEEPSKAPTPPYVPPPYTPPACVNPRPGIGSFLIVKGKQRFDGIENGEPVEISDPRKAIHKDQLEKGRGTMKCRNGFYEVEYDWDEYSTGPKPPPPPTAVLITGLSPLTTTDQISKFFRPYGRIKDIDAKMDTKSGMQLGICWVKFDGPPHGRPGTAHDVACQVVRVCDGQRISLTGNEKIKIVLDGRGIRTQKAVKEEMEKRYPPKPKVIPIPTSKPTFPLSTPSLVPAAVGTSTPSSAGAQTPRAESGISRIQPPIPKPLTGSFPSRAYRPSPSVSYHNPRYSSLPNRPGLPSRPIPVSLPSRPMGLPARPDTSVQHLASSFTAAPFTRHVDQTYQDQRRYDYADSYTPNQRRRSRSRSRSYASSYSSDYSSDSDDYRPAYKSRERSPYGRRRVAGGRVAPQTTKEDEKAAEKIKEALTANGKAHVYIDAKSLPPTETYVAHLKDHFKTFKPSQILHNHTGWYILFSDSSSAHRARSVLDNTSIHGHRLSLIAKMPSSASAIMATKKPGEEDSAPAVGSGIAQKGDWRLLTFTKKNRPAPIPTKPKADRVKIDKIKKQVIESDGSSDDDVLPIKPKKRLPSFSSASSLSDDESIINPKSKALHEEKHMDMDIDEDSVLPTKDSVSVTIDTAKDETPVGKAKKRPAAKAKVTKKNKKARLDSPVPSIEPTIEILPPPEPEVAEIILEDKAEPEPTAKKVTGKKKGPKSEFDKFIVSTVQDEEDAYWLGKALAAAKEGVEPIFNEDSEELMLDEEHPLYHTSGSWRAEGFKKIPQISKSTYLPQRNKATAAVEDTSIGVTTGRTARLAGRDQNRQTATVSATDSELFAFNQLRIRKKQLRFARSAIEGYGLYAMETIHQGEMVCEYVGELCRAAIADVREQRYLKQGIGSSYLFRIDNDIVCDATFRGSVSRLINHSCDPSANAKIIKVNGQSKIVIYAEKTLHPGEEILYDYKFPLESDPSLRVPCLCGAATCRGWLN